MLKYNEGIYQGKIDQLTEYISMLNGHIEKLTTYKDQLKMFWDDVDELCEMIYAGKIQDSKTVSAILAYKNLLNKDSGKA